MMRFARRMTVPPGGMYFYFVKETDTKLEATNMSALMHSVRRHYEVNEFNPPPNLEAEIENYMCSFMPEGFCNGVDPDAKITVWITPATLREATASMFRQYSLGLNAFVDLPKATERASICSGCEEHSRGVCTTCNGLAAFSKVMNGNRSTIYDKYLGICTVCKCMASVKVHYADEVLKKTKKRPYPKGCWMYDLGMSTIVEEAGDEEYPDDSEQGTGTLETGGESPDVERNEDKVCGATQEVVSETGQGRRKQET